MTRMEVPATGINKLTERLLAQGVKLDDPSTWPENVWAADQHNFAYRCDWKFTPTWESPCGLLIHSHGDGWGDTWVDGEFKCAENDNPLFGCPIPGKPCPHRLAHPAGINCQFHRTDREWTWDESVEALEKARLNRFRVLWEDTMRRYPDWNGYCLNLKRVDLPDGGAKYEARYNLEECIRSRCTNTQCVCRCGAVRNTRPANIFYDLYRERHYTIGMVPYSETIIHKGNKVFDKAIAWTDAEIALKIWNHNPDSHLLPSQMWNRLNASRNRETDTEAFFIRHHGRYNERVDCRLIVEVRNVRIARNETRDMLQDLMDVQNGIKVKHASDLKKAAEAKKSESRDAARIRKYSKLLADGKAVDKISRMRPDLRERIEAKARQIKAGRELVGTNAQISIFDELEGREWKKQD